MIRVQCRTECARNHNRACGCLTNGRAVSWQGLLLEWSSRTILVGGHVPAGYEQKTSVIRCDPYHAATLLGSVRVNHFNLLTERRLMGRSGHERCARSGGITHPGPGSRFAALPFPGNPAHGRIPRFAPTVPPLPSLAHVTSFLTKPRSRQTPTVHRRRGSRFETRLPSGIRICRCPSDC